MLNVRAVPLRAPRLLAQRVELQAFPRLHVELVGHERGGGVAELVGRDAKDEAGGTRCVVPAPFEADNSESVAVALT